MTHDQHYLYIPLQTLYIIINTTCVGFVHEICFHSSNYLIFHKLLHVNRWNSYYLLVFGKGDAQLFQCIILTCSSMFSITHVHTTPSPPLYHCDAKCTNFSLEMPPNICSYNYACTTLTTSHSFSIEYSKYFRWVSNTCMWH